MRDLWLKLSFAICVCLVLTLPVCAQQQNTDTNQNSGQPQNSDQNQATEPIPAYRSPLASGPETGNATGTNENPEDIAPDTRPLAGAQDVSIGTPENQRSYWQPHVGAQVTADSEGATSSGAGWTTWGSLYAGIDLHRYSGHSALNLTYSGGGVVSNDDETANGITQGLNFSDVYTNRREMISVLEQLSYLPAASSGLGLGGGFGSVGIPGIGSLGLTSTFAPGQTIFTTAGQDLLDSTVLESTTTLSRRSSISLTGGYDTQRYFDNNLLNSYGFNFEGGYNFQATRKDTLAISYIFSGFRYSNFNQSINSHIVQASYSRRVTGRLAFQIGAGPEIAYFNIPIGPTGGTSIGIGNGQLYWSLNSSLQYSLERTTLTFTYSHGISSGAGVLAGSVADYFTGGVSHRLSRTVTGSANIGYSRNSGLSVGSPTSGNQNYDYWYGGVGLNRPLGRTMNLTFSYQFQYQNSNGSFCEGVACQTSYTRNLIAVGFDWHARPRAF